MKTKLMFLLGVVMFVFAVSMAPNVHAAAAWYDCTVNSTGPSNGILYATITHVPTSGSPLFTKKWVKFPTTQGNQCLATALTAVATGKKVQINVDKDVNYPIIVGILLME
jgi:hypothetical protein